MLEDGAPRATVVIPTWNGARFLPPCLAALDAQSLGGLDSGVFETIIVDNGSTDDTSELLAGYPGLRVMPLPCNLGFAAGVNVGIRAARSDTIVLLNNDTEVAPGWLEALLKALDASPEAGMATSKVRLFDRRDHLHTTGDTLDLAGMAGNRGVWELDRGQYDQATEVFGAARNLDDVHFTKSVDHLAGGHATDRFDFGPCQKAKFPVPAVVFDHVSYSCVGTRQAPPCGRNVASAASRGTASNRKIFFTFLRGATLDSNPSDVARLPNGCFDDFSDI